MGERREEGTISRIGGREEGKKEEGDREVKGRGKKRKKRGERGEGTEIGKEGKERDAESRRDKEK